MIKVEKLAEALNYLQRINYCLKVFYIKNNEDSSSFSIGRIKNLNMEQTVNLYRNMDLDSIFTEEEKNIFSKLKKYNKFICEKCFIEFQYDLNNSIYHKKVDYVNARIDYIISNLIMFCYKVESIALENDEDKDK